MKDYTLVDGTFLPAGTFISCNALSQHLNDDIYENASEFRGFRFADLREEDGEGTKHQFVSTATDYIPFGHGRHAWYVFQLLMRHYPPSSLFIF